MAGDDDQASVGVEKIELGVELGLFRAIRMDIVDDREKRVDHSIPGDADVIGIHTFGK